MILRRLREHLRQENWLAIILDLVVVVVGIFLAFQADRWYESQRTKADLSAHLESLAEDFAENEKLLVGAISITDEEIKAAIVLREETRKDEPTLSVPELNQLFSEVSRLPTFEAVGLAYQNLVNSGELAALPSSDLKKELAEFYAAYELTKRIQNTQELQYVNILQPYILENLDYAASIRPGSTSEEDRRLLEPLFDPDLILAAMKTKQFENIVVIEWESAQDLKHDFERHIDRVTRIQTIIEGLQQNP